MQVVKINAKLLKAGPQLAPSRDLNLNFSADKVFAAVATKIDQRNENEFTWYGSVPGKPSAVTLVVKGDNVTGSATIANEQLYAIEPLGSGLYAIIRKDSAKFPPEHPPGFEGIERSRKSLEPKRDQRGDDTGQVIRVLDAHAADVAVLIFNNNAFCGLASDIMANANNAFAVVHHGCATGYYSFAHEVGHLQGARHNPEADPNNTPFAYGHGYYNASGHWRTVMSYDCPGGCTRIPYFSNPDVDYQNVPHGTAQTHNNARVLNETAPTVANFRTGPRAGSSGEEGAGRGGAD